MNWPLFMLFKRLKNQFGLIVFISLILFLLIGLFAVPSFFPPEPDEWMMTIGNETPIDMDPTPRFSHTFPFPQGIVMLFYQKDDALFPWKISRLEWGENKIESEWLPLPPQGYTYLHHPIILNWETIMVKTKDADGEVIKIWLADKNNWTPYDQPYSLKSAAHINRY